MSRKKISELEETNYLNDTDYFLVTRLNISSDGNQQTQNLSKRVSYNCIKDYMNLSSLAFKDTIVSSDISGKIPIDIIKGLSSLAFKDTIVSSDISGKIPIDIIKGLNSLAFKNEISTDIIKGLSSLAFKDTIVSSDISGKLPTDIIKGLSSLAFKDKITENDIAGTIEIGKINGLINQLISKANISDIKLSSNYFNNKPTIPVATLSVGNTQIGTISIPNSTNVNIKTNYTDGIKIANIEIDGEKTDLYIPENTSKDISYAAFPDWNPDKTYDLTSGTTLSCNGFIRFWSDTASNNSSFTRYAYINGITVARFQQWKADSTDSFDVQPVIIQASKDDVITFSSGVTAVFIPQKAQQIDLSTVVDPSNCVSYVVESGRFNSTDGTTYPNNSENDSWYRLYSDGWCEQGGLSPKVTNDGIIINLNKKMQLGYNVIISNAEETANWIKYTTDYTDTNFKIFKATSDGSTISQFWEVKGFIQK